MGKKKKTAPLIVGSDIDDSDAEDNKAFNAFIGIQDETSKKEKKKNAKKKKAEQKRVETKSDPEEDEEDETDEQKQIDARALAKLKKMESLVSQSTTANAMMAAKKKAQKERELAAAAEAAAILEANTKVIGMPIVAKDTTTVNNGPFTVTVSVPAISSEEHPIIVTGSTTLTELLSKVQPFLPSSESSDAVKLVFFGKVLEGPAEKELREYGIQGGAHLQLATGLYAQSADALTLLNVQREWEAIQLKIKFDQVHEKTLVREQASEDLVKLLIKLDSLVHVEGELKVQRKSLVTDINCQIDALKEM